MFFSDFTDSVNSENGFGFCGFRKFRKCFSDFPDLRIPEMFFGFRKLFFSGECFEMISLWKGTNNFFIQTIKIIHFWNEWIPAKLQLYYVIFLIFSTIKEKHFHYPNQFIKLNVANFFKFFWTKVIPNFLTRLISSFFF